MKTLLLLVSILFCGVALGQDVRSFYQTPTNMGFFSSLVNINGELHFVSIKERSNSEFKLTLGRLDEELNTSDYRYLNLTSNPNYLAYLSGVAVNGNILTLSILRNDSQPSIHKLEYYHIDLSSFSLISIETVPDQFKKGFVPSKIKNGKLIIYLVQDTGVLTRYEKDLTQISLPESEIVDNGPFFPLGGPTYPKYGELVFNANDEIFALKESIKIKVIRRNDSNIQIKTLSFFPANKSVALVPLPNNEILVSNARNFTILDSNLDSISSGSLYQNNLEELNKFWGIERVGNEIIEIRPEIGIIHYDFQMNVIEVKPEERKLYCQGSLIFEGDNYMFGETSNLGFSDFDDPLFGNNMPSNIFVVKNKGLDDFSEYSIDFKHNNQSKLISCFNSNVLNPTNEFSLKFNKNGALLSEIYSERTFFLGTDALGEFKGLPLISNQTKTYCSAGPLNTGNVEFNEQLDKYNRGFYVTREMIEEHLSILYWGNPNYVPKYGIRNWPAHGNTANGEASNLAEFVDLNNNGLYEPMLGDYPKIYGDKCFLNIYHQTPSSFSTNSLEFHEYHYAFECDSIPALQNTIFKMLRVINRGVTLENVNVGNYIDFDLGNATDDYIGSNVELGLMYAYNGDPMDETSANGIGFQDTIPAIGMLILKGPKLSDDGLDNNIDEVINGYGFADGIVDNEYYTLEATHVAPQIFNDENFAPLYFVSQGLNPNGSTKYSPNGTLIRHDYFGTSDPQFYSSGGIDHGNNFSEISVGNPKGDRRMLASSGPGNLNAGDTSEYITAYIISFDSINISVQNSINQLFADAAALKNAFNSNNAGCGNTFGTIQEDLATSEISVNDVSIYPNPFSSSFRISNLGNSTSHISIRDINGKLVFETKANQNIVEIPLEVQSGIYLVQVTNDLGNVVKRLVKR